MRIRALARAEVMIRVDGDVPWLPIALKVERARVKDRITCDRMIVALDHQPVAVPHHVAMHRAVQPPRLPVGAWRLPPVAFPVHAVKLHAEYRCGVTLQRTGATRAERALMMRT